MPETATEKKSYEQKADFKSREDRLKELTDQLEVGVKGVRNSAEFKNLLATMAKFPHYSVNNCILITMQKPDATLCQSYTGWKNMGRYVKKGERGIRVIAPAPYKIEKEVDKVDANGKVILDRDGEPVKETREINVMSYKAETTFDVSQTEGKELPQLAINELKGDVNKFTILMDIIKDISPVPIGFEDIKTGAKGYYHVQDKRIAIQEGMSDLQTLKTCLHEVVHAKLHADPGKEINKNRKEIEAEGTAAVVLNFFGYDTSSYSFPYLASYSTDEGLKELKSALGTIRSTSSMIIKSVEDMMIDKEKTQEMSPEQGALLEQYAKEQAGVKSKEGIEKSHHEGDTPLKNADGVVADKSGITGNVGRKILGTVRILPDGWGGVKQSLLDNLNIRKDQIKNETAEKAAGKEKEVVTK
ncbi:ArdC-like ssDNA-binding domain-containing protein [Butyrivibrio sp. NC2007]|uniref:ArdC-like ssDNA-binding domain-containing protein n=1 Tax=Butyrivibrio sp. NC2007 TaxID=1280683 RepID=UPI0003B44006|nr:ArdC-like ssDNA-binding domain-containing protein [Butyrivibrio sp. NC2007]